MKRRTILLLGAFLVATLAIGCDDSGSPSTTTATPTTPTTPMPSPSPDASAASYDAFAADLAAALEREDAEWFAEHAASFGLTVYEGTTGAFRADGGALRSLMEDAFAAADAEAEDAFGTGEWRLYAVGEEALPTDTLIVHLLATGILREPEAGRWALVFRARRFADEPSMWRLLELLRAPPDAAGRALALGPLPAPNADPDSYPEGFAAFADALESAIEDRDAGALASMLKTEPYTCPETPPIILSVPSCGDKPPGEGIDVVPWAVYCLACDAEGMATPAEIEAWLGRFFVTAEDASGDDLGPATVALESISYAGPSASFDITITGTGDPGIVDLPRPSGRWIVTFQAEDGEEGWALTGMLLGDPDSSGWVLENFRGTNVVWTQWLGIE